VEGTLSLFDWVAPSAPACAPAVSAEPVASATGSGPVLSSVPAPGDRIVIFDVETTGIDHARDQVIELCVQFGLDGERHETWRIKPSVAISPGAQAVHGISIDDLADCPSFGDVADAVIAVFADADVLVGYNLAFDIDMLQAELVRIGRPMLELAGKKIVDPFRLWQQCEPRSLQHAHQRFVGNEFAAAHSATADVAATGRVLTGMLRAFGLDTDHRDWGKIASVCDPRPAGWASWVGPSRHLRWDGDAVVVGFGKYQGTPLHELAAGPDRSFLRWVVERDFPMHVIEVCKAALDLAPDALRAWVVERFGQPAPTAQPPFAKR
jgi:DNA polymerase-3 subunit epsilon